MERLCGKAGIIATGTPKSAKKWQGPSRGRGRDNGLGNPPNLWHFCPVSEIPQAGPARSPWWQSAAAWLAGTLALVVSGAHTGVASRWYDDLGIIRTLGTWPLGAQGLVSCALTPVALLFPIGSRIFRAGLVANCGAALSAVVFFYVLRLVLGQNARTPKLTTLFAMLGAFLLALGLPMQRGATSAGGAALAVALALGAIWVDLKLSVARGRHLSSRFAIGLGVLLVAAFAEQFWAGLLALSVIGVQRIMGRAANEPGEFRRSAWGAGVAFLAVCVPLLRMQKPHRFIPELPSLVASTLDTWGDMFHLSLGGVRWWHDAGLLLTVTTMAGAIWGVTWRTLRPQSLGWVLVLLLASVFGVVDSPLKESPTTALRILAFAACVLLATLAAQTLALALLKVRVSYLGASVVVVVTLYAMMVAVHADDADYAAEGRTYRGNNVFTQEAYWTLPRHSLLLLRHRELAYRAWATRLAEGMRPDVLVVTADRLQRNPDSNRLLSMEPALVPLVREMVIRGHPTEYALSQLADTRPLFVELDNTWDIRLREHVAARGLWSEFHSQTLGRSDRYTALMSTRAPVDRVIEVCKSTVPPDTTTLHFISLRLKEQAAVFAAMGDRPGLFPLLDELSVIEAESRYVAAARKLLEEKPHGPVELDGLTN
jgi:hypothetical protein